MSKQRRDTPPSSSIIFRNAAARSVLALSAASGFRAVSSELLALGNPASNSKSSSEMWSSFIATGIHQHVRKSRTIKFVPSSTCESPPDGAGDAAPAMSGAAVSFFGGALVLAKDLNMLEASRFKLGILPVVFFDD